jgi:hypothetical protein
MMAAVEALGVFAVQLPHSTGQITVHRFYQQMIVIGHLAKSMNHPVKSGTHIAQYLQPITAIFVAQENIFPTIPA